MDPSIRPLTYYRCIVSEAHANVRCACAQLPVPPALLEISSLNRLLGLAGRIMARHVASEPQEAAAARWREWLEVAGQLGLAECHLAVALAAPGKALMISMHMAARYGSGRVSFKVASCLMRRRTPFQVSTTISLYLWAPFLHARNTESGLSRSAIERKHADVEGHVV